MATSLHLSASSVWINEREETPLHTAIMHSLNIDLSRLLRNGLDVNAQTEGGFTPLHYAAACGKADVVATLLYFGADVNITCDCGFPPLSFALSLKRFWVAKMLLPFYSEMPSSDPTCSIPLPFSTKHSAGSFMLGDKGMKYIVENGKKLSSFDRRSAPVFKLAWSTCDHQNLVNDPSSFLTTFIENMNFSLAEWLECFYIVLDSNIAEELVRHSRIDQEKNECFKGIFWKLARAFYLRKVQRFDRVAIISACLSLGAAANLPEVNLFYQQYGFNDEFEALIYTVGWYQIEQYSNYHFTFLLPTYLCTMEEVNNEMMLVYNKRQLRLSNYFMVRDNFQLDLMQTIGFSSLSLNMKEELMNMCKRHMPDYKRLCDKIQTIPERPSLREMSRDKVRAHIKSRYNVRHPHQFHDVIRGFGLPPLIQDILLFKLPIY